MAKECFTDNSPTLSCVCNRFRFYDYYTTGHGFRWDGDVFGNAIDGFLFGSILSVLPILGWKPWQLGFVTLDQQVLRVPRLWNVLVFKRSGHVRVRIQKGFGGGYYLCHIEDLEKSVFIYIDEQSLDILRKWVAT